MCTYSETAAGQSRRVARGMQLVSALQTRIWYIFLVCAYKHTIIGTIFVAAGFMDAPAAFVTTRLPMHQLLACYNLMVYLHRA